MYEVDLDCETPLKIQAFFKTKLAGKTGISFILLNNTMEAKTRHKNIIAHNTTSFPLATYLEDINKFFILIAPLDINQQQY
jgi:hypothetical protein